MVCVQFVRSQTVLGHGHFNTGEVAAFPDAFASLLCTTGAAVVVVPEDLFPEELPPTMPKAVNRPPAHKMVRRAPAKKGGRHAQ